LQRPALSFKGNAAVIADYTVPRKGVLFTEGMKHSYSLARAVGEACSCGNVAIAGNLALGHREYLFDDAAGGVFHRTGLLAETGGIFHGGRRLYGKDKGAAFQRHDACACQFKDAVRAQKQ